MPKIRIEFPDGSKKSYEKGVTGLDIAKSIGERLGRDALAIKVNDKLMDLTKKINKNAKIQILTFKDKEGKEIFWHSASHLMTQAVLRVFPKQNIGLGVGAAVDDGYYQDYDMKPLHPDDLKKIESEMHRIVAEKLEIKQRNAPKKEILKFYKKDPYKTNLVNRVKGQRVSMYIQGEFDNLCKGPHVPNTSYLKAFKLMNISGAYWEGNHENKQLQRIYGVAFPDKKQLKKHLEFLEEAEKRDHRKLGKELDLFSLHEEGPGFIFWHPKGSVLINNLLDYWRKEHNKYGYMEVKTPIFLDRKLWEQSGHWDNYKDNMYFTHIDNRDFAVKPMNCPGGILIFKEQLPSYRELPMKIAELGLVHRHELSGTLAGLFRVRSFTQDDAHIYMTPDQIKKNVIEVIKLTDKIYKTFGFEYDIELSTRPDKSIGTDKMWNDSTKALKDALESMKIKYKINEGDGAFYGPKIDFHLKDCLGRTWQCGTIQLDMAMPEKFKIQYIAEDGNRHKVVMLHRTILGSIERFVGILIEHYAGKFPLWLSPLQVKVLTVADRFSGYAEKVKDELVNAGFRVEVDARTESVSYKVREAQSLKIPVIINVGEKEEKNKTVAIRTLDNKLHFGVKVKDLISKMQKNCDGLKQTFII